MLEPYIFLELTFDTSHVMATCTCKDMVVGKFDIAMCTWLGIFETRAKIK